MRTQNSSCWESLLNFGDLDVEWKAPYSTLLLLPKYYWIQVLIHRGFSLNQLLVLFLFYRRGTTTSSGVWVCMFYSSPWIVAIASWTPSCLVHCHHHHHVPPPNLSFSCFFAHFFMSGLWLGNDFSSEPNLLILHFKILMKFGLPSKAKPQLPCYSSKYKTFLLH